MRGIEKMYTGNIQLYYDESLHKFLHSEPLCQLSDPANEVCWLNSGNCIAISQRLVSWTELPRINIGVPPLVTFTSSRENIVVHTVLVQD
jgi:hypothetical protein